MSHSFAHRPSNGSHALSHTTLLDRRHSTLVVGSPTPLLLHPKMEDFVATAHRCGSKTCAVSFYSEPFSLLATVALALDFASSQTLVSGRRAGLRPL